MSFMDRLPTVDGCCFCCGLRLGTVMVGFFSLLIGITFISNISFNKGLWFININIANCSIDTGFAFNKAMGIASIMLCIISIILLVGAFWNLPLLIKIYIWGTVFYSGTVMVLFLIQIVMCFLVHSNNCYLACGLLGVLMVIIVILMLYFILVPNSLRISLEDDVVAYHNDV